MDTDPSRAVWTAGMRPGDVPFTGWSTAAHEFRTLAAESAPGGGNRPLIIGDPGSGKRTMARAWLYLLGPGVTMPIEVLEELSVRVPERFIGLTACRPSPGRPCILLGSGRRGEVQEALPGRPPLDDAMMERFELYLYIPPIRPDRPIDVLAFLDYWNRARGPAVGIRYRAIEEGLLRRMLLGDGFPENFRGIHRTLRILNHLNRQALAGDRGERAGDPVAGDAGDGPAPIVLDVLRESRGELAGCSSGDSEDACSIPFDGFRDLAVRIYLWCCQNGHPDGRSTERAEKGTAPESIPGSLREFDSGPTAAEFLALTEEEFVRKLVLPGVPAWLAGRSDRLSILTDRVRNQRVFGTDLRSLQAGLRIDPCRVAQVVGLGKSGSRREPKAGQSTPASLVSGPFGRFCSSPAGEGENTFLLQDGQFSISFRATGGSIEEGKFARKDNSGMAYYRYLLMHPEKGFSSLEIERACGRVERRRVCASRDVHELGEARGEANYDQTLDREYKKQIAKRLADIERELIIAERRRDSTRIAELERERAGIRSILDQSVRYPTAALDAISRRLEEARRETGTAESDGDDPPLLESAGEEALLGLMTRIIRRSRARNLDRSARWPLERVRKVTEDARTKLKVQGLVQLEDYLRRKVWHEGDLWAYHPTSLSLPWRT